MPAAADPIPGSGDAEVLILRLDAPLLSFGTVAVDETRPTGELPGRSLLTGLLANALGWYHQDAEALQRLQERLVYAVRQERPGQLLEDYQTVDLGQDFLRQGWTSRGRPDGRGGAFKTGTHIRKRHYLADAAFTVALLLDPPEEEPTLEQVERALLMPARPLFLGRKACLPSRPLLGHSEEEDRCRALDPLTALIRVPPWLGVGRGRVHRVAYPVWWPGSAAGAPPDETLPPGVRFHHSFPVYDERNWHHQFHAGRRFVNAGQWIPPEPDSGGDSGGEAGHA